MSTDIALPAENRPAIIDPTGGRLVAWAEAAGAAHQLAVSLSKTSFVPKDFAGKPDDATAAIILGDELGLSPLSALRSIYVVHGTPAIYARTMRALALSHGHQMWTELATDSKVVVCGQRRGSDKVERREWTIARAQKAGYTKNPKYSSNTQEMLQAKADAEVARLIAADVLAGIPYSVEDLELEQPEPTVSVTRADRPAETTKVSRKKPAAEPEPEPEPPLEPEAAAEPEPTPEPADDKPSEKQVKFMFALFKEAGITDKDAMLAYIADVIGHSIQSRSELSAAEVSACIDALNGGAADA